MSRTFRRAVAGVAVLLTLTACGGKGKESLSGAPAPGTVVVGSADFPESTLLAEIYAKALESKQIKVSRKLNIGSREVYFDQLQQGALSVMPEYNGALLAYIDKESKATTAEAVNAELAAKLPPGLTLLTPSEAEDKDSISVTKETAARDKLKSIADLAPVAKTLVMGGPPTFKTRYEAKLKEFYGVQFKQLKSLDAGGPITVAALKQGDVQAADMFTTAPAIQANSFVVLDDPKRVFSAQNVVPLVYDKAVDSSTSAALDAVSAKLDTPTLMHLMNRVVSDKEDAATVAVDWLKSVGL